MRKIIISLLLLLVLGAMLSNFSSCGKEVDTPPTISLDTASVFVSADTMLYRHTVFTIWISASKTGTDGMLTTFKITKSHNGDADSLFQEMNFVYQYFSQYYSYQAGDSGDTDLYTFTVGKQDGLSSSKSILITAN